LRKKKAKENNLKYRFNKIWVGNKNYMKQRDISKNYKEKLKIYIM
jgi:hypothetical protein